MPSPTRPQPPAKPPARPASPPPSPNPATPMVWFAGLAGVVAILLLFLAVSF